MKRILLLFLLLLTTLPAHAENWVTVYNDKYSFDVDESRISRKGDKATFYIAERNKKKSLFFNVEVDCKTRQFRTLSIGNDPKASMSLLVDPQGGWETPRKEDKQAVVNHICGKAKK